MRYFVFLFLLLCACSKGDEEKDNNTAKTVVDLTNPNDLKLLGKDYKVSLTVAKVEALKKESDFLGSITVFDHPSGNKTGTYAQVHDVPLTNYKFLSDFSVEFLVAAITKKGKNYTLKNYDLYYEDFSKTKTPEGLASSKIENDPSNVKILGRKTSIHFNKKFLVESEGKYMNLRKMRPLILYVKVGDYLSNGIQCLFMVLKSGSLRKIPTTPSGKIENTSSPFKENGFLQRTSVVSKGYNIPILIEDLSKQKTNKRILHAKNILKYLLDSFDESISKNMSESKACLAFFYDSKWKNRQENNHNNWALHNILFQDLFATETMPELPPRTRDASFEEILHLIHDYSFMVESVQNKNSKFYQMQKTLDSLNRKAILKGIYYPNGKNSKITEAELDIESYDQEYLAYAFYAYYDLNYVGYTSEEYIPTDYNSIKEKDPEMVNFFEKYFPSRADLKKKFPGYPLE